MYTQKGVGMVEVLVSLVLLSIAVLGFAVLQFKAIDAMQEAGDRTVAMSLARDVAERIRVNRTKLTEYKNQINSGTLTSAKNCMVADSNNSRTTTPMCSQNEMATYDAVQILQMAKAAGMTVIVDSCQGGDRQCIYIAWGETTISAGNVTTCMSGGVYVAGSSCLVMEAYGT
ncbi:type IV pilus modification protein PilV [Acinetobacter indicus]|nr:type IV pilus modification protein PilV [Acinetobacter indicus]